MPRALSVKQNSLCRVLIIRASVCELELNVKANVSKAPFNSNATVEKS